MDGRLIEHKLADIRLLGYSIAGEETVIAAPELNVCFDVGKAPAEILAIDHVFLSHGHMDHSAGIAYYLSQRNFVGNAPGCVILPEALAGPVQDLMRVWGRIEGHMSPARIVGLQKGGTFQVRKGLVAHAFELNHRAPSLGYCIVDVRHKLRPEFAGRTGPELVALKKQGVSIEHNVEVPLLAYCGDTAEGSWMNLDIVRRARVLLLECTFFDADHVTRARAGYHLHVRDVARILPKMENEYFVLHHVSRRTSLREAKGVLAKMVPPEVLARVKFLMDGKRFRPTRPLTPPPDTGSRG